MSSGCKSSLGCADAREPVRANYMLLYKWPDSDVEFVKSMTLAGSRGQRSGDDLHRLNSFSSLEEEQRRRRRRPSVVDGYSCRQLYLRSYTFTRKQTLPEKTRRCLRRVKEMPILNRSSSANSSSTSFSSARKNQNQRKREKKKKKEEDCASARKLREMACSALRSVFHGLLFCAASVEVAD